MFARRRQAAARARIESAHRYTVEQVRRELENLDHLEPAAADPELARLDLYHTSPDGDRSWYGTYQRLDDPADVPMYGTTLQRHSRTYLQVDGPNFDRPADAPVESPPPEGPDDIGWSRYS